MIVMTFHQVTPQLLGNIGTLYHKLGNTEMALSFYNKVPP